MTKNPWGNMQSLLKGVSRSFYLTIRVLPRRVRLPIGLAYLLARATDTVADTRAVAKERRLETLRGLARAIEGNTLPELGLRDFSAGEVSAGERELLDRLPQVLEWLHSTHAKDRENIQSLLARITRGQEQDLLRFHGADSSQVVALQSDEELDEYTYLVAGCVGEFWTSICRRWLYPKAHLDESTLFENAVRFGKGLQMVNILRDLSVDLRIGRCYIPSDALRTAGLTPSDLLNPESHNRFRPLYESYLERARGHLVAGWDYTLMMPRSQPRVVLACSWPILIGIATLGGLERCNPLAPEDRLKISRRDVRSIVIRSVLTYPFGGLWAGQFERIRRREDACGAKGPS